MSKEMREQIKVKKWKQFLNENINIDDLELTNFRKSISGYGDSKEKYSYNNNDDIDEIFNIIDSIIYFDFISQKLKNDKKINKKVDNNIDFIKNTNGVSWENGGIVLKNISKKDFIKKYFQHIKNLKS